MSGRYDLDQPILNRRSPAPRCGSSGATACDGPFIPDDLSQTLAPEPLFL